MANHYCLLFCLCLSVNLVNCGIDKVYFKDFSNILLRSKRGYGYGASYNNYNNNYNQDQDDYSYSNQNHYGGSSYQHRPNYNQNHDEDLRLSQQYSENPFLNHAFSNDGNQYSSYQNQYPSNQNQYLNNPNQYSNNRNEYTNTANSNGYVQIPNTNSQKQIHSSYISHYGYGQNQYPTEENIETSYNQNVSEPAQISANTNHKTNTIDLSNNIFFNGVFRNLKNQATSTTPAPNNNIFDVLSSTPASNNHMEEVFNPTPASNNYKEDTFSLTPASNNNMEDIFSPTPASNNHNMKEVFNPTSSSDNNMELFNHTPAANNEIVEAFTSPTVLSNNIIEATTVTPVPNSTIKELSEADYDIRIDVLDANQEDSDIVENNLFILKSSTAPSVTATLKSDNIDIFANTAKETTPNVEAENGIFFTNTEINKHKETTSQSPISNSDLETIFGRAQNNFALTPAVSFDEGTFLINGTLNKDKVERTTLPALQPMFSASRASFAAPCQPPSGGQGSCISIMNCSRYLELLRSAKTNPSARQELINAQCGTEGRIPKVCCPTLISGSGENSGGFIKEPLPRPILQLPVSPQCGGANFKFSRVVGGIPASLGELPWMALLGYHGRRTPQPRWLCGGSLITARHVLTAAHCVHNYENDLYQVRLGELDLSSETEGPAPIDVPIRQQIKHEHYDHVTHKNDIALLELDFDVQFTAEIKPICMPKDSDLRSKTFERYRPIVAGWGDTRYRGPSSPQLLMVQLPVSSKDSCQASYQPFKNQITIDDSMLCAGLPQGGQDACQGDSGGPLAQPILRNGATVWYQIGVVSYGKKCAEPNTPGVYTRVTEFIPWIEQKISG